MSRGPGRMMRAALAELDGGSTGPWTVARRAHHDARCACGDIDYCRPFQFYEPTRSELVSARRALHSLAARGLVELSRVSNHWTEGPAGLTALSVANGGCYPPPATHKARA